MKKKNQSEDNLSFFRTVPPFGDLSKDSLVKLLQNVKEVSFPNGTLIFEQGMTEINALYIIKKGGVRIFLKDDEKSEIWEEYRGPGDYFGALGIIMETRANLCVESIGDTCCILLPKEGFRSLLATRPEVSLFFLKSFSARYIHSAHSELQSKKNTSRDESSLFLFSHDVGGVLKGKLHTCLPTNTAREAAEKMALHGIGSLLVQTDDGQVQGILTDKDIRNKLVAKGLSCEEPVKSIMSSPVKTTPSEAVCFDALFSMLQNRIHHLAVQREGRIVGMITSHDILLLQGASPLFLFKEIAAQTEIEGLYGIPKQFPVVVHRLIEDGAKASNINRMITVLNDQILDRVLTFLIRALGAPPVPFCWMVMGSEGRKEQTFKTDQDNAIIYEDVGESMDQAYVRDYFLTLAQEAVQHLAACGYALCKGNMMASNPDWTQSLSGWKRTFDRWIYSPNVQEILNSTIFFDFRPGFGKVELALSLREHLLKRTAQEKVFTHHLAKDCLSSRSPLSFLKKIVVEKGGPHRGHFDLKTKGLTPFVDFARLMCLDRGFPATNTLERIQSLCENKAISDEFAKKITESYEFQMQLRLIHQMDLIKNGREPDNFINPSELSDIEMITLKKAFQMIDEIRSFLGSCFNLNLG